MNPAQEVGCVFCGKPGAKVLHELPHVWHQPPESGKIVVRWCDSCAVGFVDPIPDESRIAELYGSTYFNTYGTKLHGKPPSGLMKLVWRALTRAAWSLDRSCPVTPKFLSRFVPPGSLVCDLGCGPGVLLRDLRAQGFVACGVEPDPTAVKLCVDQGLDVLPGTAEALPAAIRGRKFDAVIMTQVLEHCRDPLAALRGAVGLLRPGGYLIVEVPNAGSLVARAMGPTWFHADVGRHLYFFTPRCVASLAQRVGAQVVDTVFSDYTSQFLADRLLAEQEVWDALHQPGSGPVRLNNRRPSLLQRGALLARTAVAGKAERYGVVAVVAQIA